MQENLTPEAPITLPGQMSFFPEQERVRGKDPALVRPIPPPDLTDSWLISVLTADVIARFDGKLREDWLHEILVGAGHISYFAYSDALGGLLENAAAVRIPAADGSDVITLTPTGMENVKRLRKCVPKVFRDRVHLTALRYAARQQALRDLRICYEPDSSGCVVCMTCSDQGQEMFSLRIHAPNRENAEMLGERVSRNPAGFFGKIIDLALHNEEAEYDLSDN